MLIFRTHADYTQIVPSSPTSRRLIYTPLSFLWLTVLAFVATKYLRQSLALCLGSTQTGALAHSLSFVLLRGTFRHNPEFSTLPRQACKRVTEHFDLRFGGGLARWRSPTDFRAHGTMTR